METANIIISILLILLIVTFVSHIVIVQKNPPQPVNVPIPVGGCAGTIYGCCPDGKTSKMNAVGSNCFSEPPLPYPKPIGGCAGTRYGCCPNGQTPKMNYIGTNCYK
jgi:hypothetical protein